MHTPLRGQLRPRHYEPFAEWLSQTTGRPYTVAS